MAGGVPRSIIVAGVVAAVVAAGALGGAAAIRWRAAKPAAAAVTSPKAVGVSGCLIEPCEVVAHTAVGGTSVELLADFGARSGRLRVGSATAGQVIETTVTDLGVTLTPDSLQCVPGSPAACLIKGAFPGGVAGQVVVGRSDSWSALDKPFLSNAGYLGLDRVNGDSAPEVLAAQRDCGDAQDCAGRQVFLQVFSFTGTVLGCSKAYSRLEKLPGFPAVHITEAALTPCR